jgi:Lon protease-like protein
MECRRLPMFPLERPLVPYDRLPLHIFELRYRQMIKECMAGEPEFGVVLIERGREVGGGDQRFSVGTLARIVDAVELADGRWVLEAVGIQRLVVDRWLEDDPYPCAEVLPLDDEEPADDLEVLRGQVEQLLRRSFALRAELGGMGLPSDFALTDDPVVAAYHAAIVSGLGPIDVQSVLETAGAEARLQLMATLLDDQVDLLTRRLEQG